MLPDKEKYVQVFNDHAEAYDRFRPGYPMQLIDDIIEMTGLDEHSAILEIGCGTGQLTLDFAKRNFSITAVEKGAALARLATQKLESYPRVRIIEADFEQWDTTERFQLVISAQAFHWIDMEQGLQKVHRLLHPGGSVALIWHMDLSQDTEFWKKTSPLYDEYLPLKTGHRSMEDTVNDHQDYLNTLSSFGPVVRKEYPWTQVYSKEEHLGLIGTYSPHMRMEPARRAEFFGKIAELIDAQGGAVERFYRTVLLWVER